MNVEDDLLLAARQVRHIAARARNQRTQALKAFWDGLVINQEVRWLGAKKATYFVHSTRHYSANPAWPRDPRRGPFIELRRHTGTTFFAHLWTVRPHINVPPRPLFDQEIFDDDIERQAETVRERTTIYVPTWCRDCSNTGIRAVRRGPDDWDVEECPRKHDDGRITVHFNWKREPRWFE